jgi:hypothetical protein
VILFDQLRVSDDGKRMYISIHVNRASYFDDIYLDEIVITTADKVLETSPTIPSEDYIYKKVFDNGMKEADIVLLPTDFNEHFTKSNFSSDLFFVYVKVKGTPDPCTPCRLDEEVTLGVTFDESLLYQQVMQFTKSLSNEWAAKGVNVNCIAPGYFDTEMNTALIADPVRSEQISVRIPIGRWGKPSDLVGTAIFLASEASDYVSGITIPVDGGWLGR